MSSMLFRKILDVVITVIAVVLIAIALMWFVHTFNVFELPSFVRRFIEQDTVSTETISSSESDLLSLIESENYIDEDFSYVTLTVDKARKLLSSVTTSEDYFWKVETTVIYGSSSRSQTHYLYKHGDKVRIDTEEDNILMTTVFSDGRAVSINNATGEKSEFSGDTDFSYTNIVNIAALESFFNKNDAVVDYVAFVDLGDEKYIYVEIPKQNVNGTDKYFVSLVHGVVTYASSVIDGVEYFTQKTLEFDADSVISDNAFELNDSEIGESLTLRSAENPFPPEPVAEQ